MEQNVADSGLTNIFQIQIILLHYNVLHSHTEFDASYGNPQ